MTPCSFGKCVAGHVWLINLKIDKCSGCGGFALIRQVSNCPTCNEPADEITLRVDHLGGPVPFEDFKATARCKGQIPMGFSGDIVISREKGEDEKSWEADHAEAAEGEKSADRGDGVG